MEMYKKIGKAEFKCPHWFSTDVKRLLQRILDPNPSTRISMEKIMENPWFRKGLNAKLLRYNLQTKDAPPVDIDSVNTIATMDSKHQEERKPINMNAFDIISLSAGLDLSGMFEESDKKKESKFTSTNTSSTIISKIEDVAKSLRLKLTKKDGGLLKMEGSKPGRKGVMGIDAEIFEVSPNLHLVEIKKANGDTLEYQKVLNQEMRPALRDIVWAWQGEQAKQQQQQQSCC
jgi:serine/threonine protein kinase